MLCIDKTLSLLNSAVMTCLSFDAIPCPSVLSRMGQTLTAGPRALDRATVKGFKNINLHCGWENTTELRLDVGSLNFIQAWEPSLRKSIANT